MFTNYYRNKFKSVVNKINEFNISELSKLNTFNEAISKYYKLNKLYDEAAKYCKKIPNANIDEKDKVLKQEYNKLYNLYNKIIEDLLKEKDEIKSYNKLELVIDDLNKSMGYGFNSIIQELQNSINVIKSNFHNIHHNYNNNLKTNEQSTNKIENKCDYSNEEPLYDEIVDFVVTQGKASASLLQRRFRLGYNRAARAIDLLEENGIIGHSNSDKPRQVLVGLSNNTYSNKTIIDFNSIYGLDYKKIENEKNFFIDNYSKNAKSIFEKMGLNIIFDEDKTFDINLLNNTLFVNSEFEDIIDFINHILSVSYPNKIKIALIDYSQINLQDYKNIPHLISPIVSDEKKVSILFDKLIYEMDNRYELFLNSRVKNIKSYNKNNDEDKNIPYIIVLIDEIYEVIKNTEIKNKFTKLLMNSKNSGIIVICFSKFNKKNISLFMLEDLLLVTKYTTDYLEFKSNSLENNIHSIDKDMNGFDFEKYSAQLLMCNGFSKVSVTPCSNDYGVDVIAYKDEIKYAIQCKKYTNTVGIKAVQEVLGSKSMNNCHVAVVLTNNYFTKSAKELAEKNGVLLWDRDKLLELMNNLNK